MAQNKYANNNLSLLNRWLRFTAGLILLFLFAGVFVSGYVPPGAAGKVLRHNMENDIDASPLFYSELDNIDSIVADIDNIRDSILAHHDK